MNDTIGIFYELPDGSIVKAYGWNGGTNTVHYYMSDLVGRSVEESVWATWKPRRDLVDFANVNNPLLPQIFDLLWNLKRWTDLATALSAGHHDEISLREAMSNNDLTEDAVRKKVGKSGLDGK